MELYLNFVWAMVASASVWLWRGRRTLVNRRMSFVGLFLFIVILFPLISVSDDLWSIRNPAQAKTLERRNDRATRPHSAFAAIIALPEPGVAQLNFGFQRLGASLHAPILAVNKPALDPSRTSLLPQPNRTSSKIQVLSFFLLWPYKTRRKGFA